MGFALCLLMADVCSYLIYDCPNYHNPTSPQENDKNLDSLYLSFGGYIRCVDIDQIPFHIIGYVQGIVVYGHAILAIIKNCLVGLIGKIYKMFLKGFIPGGFVAESPPFYICGSNIQICPMK